MRSLLYRCSSNGHADVMKILRWFSASIGKFKCLKIVCGDVETVSISVLGSNMYRS